MVQCMIKGGLYYGLINLFSDCFCHICMKKMKFMNGLPVCSHFQPIGLESHWKKTLISQFNPLQSFVRTIVGKSSPIT